MKRNSSRLYNPNENMVIQYIDTHCNIQVLSLNLEGTSLILLFVLRQH